MTILGSLRRLGRFGGGLCALLLVALCAALPAAADTIIETGVGANGPSVNGGQFEAQGWTQTETYEDVSISVALFSWMPGATFDITAYLTTEIGPLGTSSALASMSFSGETPDSNPRPFLLFSGLTLGPGAYFLTLSSTDNGGGEQGALWPLECSSGCPLTLDSGVVLLSQYFVNQSFGAENIAYAPGSIFMTSSPALNLSITNDPPDPATPEPATLPAAIVGMAGLLIAAKFCSRRA
ncbi:MAG: hypothetical protein WBY44_34210 [Bryobacteraceae bacterium]|jgi:hypothetical protein